ncbi:MAG: helix-turn-helix domain-containing protein [Candidatus Omnitrophica bacterium]|nr:helix-turn-helix domain-containing protein [Candidatus Omnitrophota bacterium]
MEKLLTVKQLSEIIQVSPKTVYYWAHIGYIPHIRFPKGIRFSERAVFQWLNKRAVRGRNSYVPCVEI